MPIATTCASRRRARLRPISITRDNPRPPRRARATRWSVRARHPHPAPSTRRQPRAHPSARLPRIGLPRARASQHTRVWVCRDAGGFPAARTRARHTEPACAFTARPAPTCRTDLCPRWPPVLVPHPKALLAAAQLLRAAVLPRHAHDRRARIRRVRVAARHAEEVAVAARPSSRPIAWMRATRMCVPRAPAIRAARRHCRVKISDNKRGDTRAQAARHRNAGGDVRPGPAAVPTGLPPTRPRIRMRHGRRAAPQPLQPRGTVTRGPASQRARTQLQKGRRRLARLRRVAPPATGELPPSPRSRGWEPLQRSRPIRTDHPKAINMIDSYGSGTSVPEPRPGATGDTRTRARQACPPAPSSTVPPAFVRAADWTLVKQPDGTGPSTSPGIEVRT